MRDSEWVETSTTAKDPRFRRLVKEISDNAPRERIDITAASAADTAFSVSHSLGRIPTSVIQHAGDAAGIIYATTDDRAAWSRTALQLRCSVANWHGKIDVY